MGQIDDSGPGSQIFSVYMEPRTVLGKMEGLLLLEEQKSWLEWIKKITECHREGKDGGRPASGLSPFSHRAIGTIQ